VQVCGDKGAVQLSHIERTPFSRKRESVWGDCRHRRRCKTDGGCRPLPFFNLRHMVCREFKHSPTSRLFFFFASLPFSFLPLLSATVHIHIRLSSHILQGIDRCLQQPLAGTCWRDPYTWTGRRNQEPSKYLSSCARPRQRQHQKIIITAFSPTHTHTLQFSCENLCHSLQG